MPYRAKRICGSTGSLFIFVGFWWCPLGHGARTALPGAGSVLPVVGLAAALLALTGLDFPALA